MPNTQAEGGNANRALLVAVELPPPRRVLSRSAAAARSAAEPGHPLDAEAVMERAASDREDALDNGIDVAPRAAEERSRAHRDFDSELLEFRELVESAGGVIAGEVLQRRLRPDPATLVGKGKMVEIAGAAASAEADVVLFDQNLSPTQLRNLERALPCRVVDRTQLILDIFARHARTREGQLQVELAQLEYMLPRLTGRGAEMSQLGGGIGTRGPGETKLETDRRRIGRRLVQLRRELESVRRVRAQQRQRREAVPVPTVALVGYTNAGKSTLFNALTQADVLSSSRMFATLDPKLRAILLPSRRKVLLSDTVGFIRDLPHTLVTSFRATLEEVQKAEVLLHVQDCASGRQEEQKAEVEKVLAELGCKDKPHIEVWNKIDLLDGAERAALAEGPGLGSGRVLVSAVQGEGLDALLAKIDKALEADPLVRKSFRIPQSEGATLAALARGARLGKRRFEEEDALFSAQGPASLLNRYRKYWVAETE